MTLEWNPLHCNFHPFTFEERRNDVGMTEWQWNEVVFGGGEKNWILRCPSFQHHSVIPTSFHFDESFSHWLRSEWAWMGWNYGLNHLDHIPHHSTVIPVWSLILSLDWDWDWNELEWRGMRSEWFNLVLSPIRRQHRIKSFRPHFTSFHCYSSLIIDSLPWLRLE